MTQGEKAENSSSGDETINESSERLDQSLKEKHHF